MVNLLSTGVTGLDSLLNGGFIRGSTTLLIGPVESLKSHVAWQFIYAGLVSGEQCLYISTLKRPHELGTNPDLSLKPFLKNDLLRFVDLSHFWKIERQDPHETTLITSICKEIFPFIRGLGDGRAVVDNVSHLFYFTDDAYSVVRVIAGLKVLARESNVTLLLIMDEGCIDRRIEESIRTICDYVLLTIVDEGVCMIKVLKSVFRSSLGWHVLYLAGNGVDVEVIR